MDMTCETWSSRSKWTLRRHLEGKNDEPFHGRQPEIDVVSWPPKPGGCHSISSMDMFVGMSTMDLCMSRIGGQKLQQQQKQRQQKDHFSSVHVLDFIHQQMPTLITSWNAGKRQYWQEKESVEERTVEVLTVKTEFKNYMSKYNLKGTELSEWSIFSASWISQFLSSRFSNFIWPLWQEGMQTLGLLWKKQGLKIRRRWFPLGKREGWTSVQFRDCFDFE